ncbi:MAG TPA: hypothetical protein PLF13_09135 [candidate division Zixibacteria bacterium]|nr:hypothetical protein [candidate division Zixibacteria bacterium]
MKIPPTKLNSRAGFGLIELTVLIVVIGIMAAVALQSAQTSVDDSREVETREEMQALSYAIVGDPNLMSGGQRSDFGYVGDIGAFPPNLQALYSNPGAYTTWDGPYFPIKFQGDSSNYRYDAWGAPYVYDGALTITSSGSGSNIVQSLGHSTTDFLYNEVTGTIADSSGSAPGTDFDDSVRIEVVIPNGSGHTTIKTAPVSAVGTFTLDSLPIGLHPVRAIYLPENDTLSRFVAVMPRNRGTLVFHFPTVQFASDSTSAVDNTIIVSTDSDASLVGQAMEDEDLVAYDRILMTASMYLEGDDIFSSDEDIDAVHIDSSGTIVFSTDASGSIGMTWFDRDDLVRYNPVTGLATVIFDGSSRFWWSTDIDAVYVYPNGNLVMSVRSASWISWLYIDDEDLFGYDPSADTAWMIFNGSHVFTSSADIDAVHILDDGNIVFSCDATAQIGTLTFDDEDLVLYSPSTGQATLYWDGDVPFGTTGEDIDALYIGYVEPPSGDIDTLVLRPNGVGNESHLSTSGCGDNYQCVDESSPDEDATRLEQASNSYADDAYAIEDPTVSSGSIVGVRVVARCRRHHMQGDVRLLLSISGTEYYGTSQNLSGGYTDYSETWSTNPATSAEWTWSDITSLQAGISLRGQNFHFPGYCTQVWVEVIYAD